jgi:hypothetical protein
MNEYVFVDCVQATGHDPCSYSTDQILTANYKPFVISLVWSDVIGVLIFKVILIVVVYCRAECFYHDVYFTFFVTDIHLPMLHAQTVD